MLLYRFDTNCYIFFILNQKFKLLNYLLEFIIFMEQHFNINKNKFMKFSVYENI